MHEGGFTGARLCEIQALLDSAVEFGEGVHARRTTTREGYDRWGPFYDEPGNQLRWRRSWCAATEQALASLSHTPSCPRYLTQCRDNAALLPSLDVGRVLEWHRRGGGGDVAAFR